MHAPVTKQQAAARGLQDVRDDIDELLHAHYRARQQQAVRIHADYGQLWSSLLQAYDAGGKRFRPYLAVLAYQALGGQEYRAVLPACAALELLHAAMLMHDDIIDRDYYRHGQPNVGGWYRRHYAALVHNDQAEADHYASGAALLGGDLLLSDAYQLILTATVPSRQKVRLMQLLGDTLYRLCGGELLDAEAVLHPPEYADSLQIALLKSGDYSCSLPLEFGAILAGAGQKTVGTLRNIGATLGVAFQLADDLLGMFGTPAETGKSALSDLREGKRSLLVQRGLALAAPAQRTALLRILGNPACDETMAAQARQILVDSGARSEVEERMRQHAHAAAQLIATLPVDRAAQQRLQDFAQQAIWRSA